MKLEYIDRPLGESAKVDCGVDKPAEFNYNATVTILFEDPASLDEVAHRPVLCMCAFSLYIQYICMLTFICYWFYNCTGSGVNIVK